MLKPILILMACLASGSVPATEKQPMFGNHDFAQLKFLEGRWKGTAPDGSAFYEQYDFPTPAQMRSRRFSDAGFVQSTDSSTVALKDGVVTSQWGKFTWQASELSAGKACFEPVNAPSSFCWQRHDADTVHVTQRWQDEQGVPQEYVVPLQRL